MIQKVYTFQNCTGAVEELRSPEGEMAGRAFVIIDQDTGDVYRMPLTLDACKTLGSDLMGLGGLEVVGGTNGSGSQKIIKHPRTNTPKR